MQMATSRFWKLVQMAYGQCFDLAAFAGELSHAAWQPAGQICVAGGVRQMQRNCWKDGFAQIVRRGLAVHAERPALDTHLLQAQNEAGNRTCLRRGSAWMGRPSALLAENLHEAVGSVWTAEDLSRLVAAAEA